MTKTAKMTKSFKKFDVILSLWIPPSYLGNVKRGAYCQLENFLLSYVDRFGGVVVAFSNVRVLEKGGLIYYDQPEIHFHVSVQFLVFCPFAGEHVTGVISHVGYDSIGAIVHGIFNASISAPKEIDNYKVGDEINFIVKDVVRMHHIPGMKIVGRLKIEQQTKSSGKKAVPTNRKIERIELKENVGKKKKRDEDQSAPKKKKKKT